MSVWLAVYSNHKGRNHELVFPSCASGAPWPSIVCSFGADSHDNNIAKVINTPLCAFTFGEHKLVIIILLFTLFLANMNPSKVIRFDSEVL